MHIGIGGEDMRFIEKLKKCGLLWIWRGKRGGFLPCICERISVGRGETRESGVVLWED